MRLGCWALALCMTCATPVLAQAVPETSAVLILDSDRLYLESRYGQQIRDGLDADAAALKAENDRIVEMLTDEERSLTLRRPTLDADAFRKEAEAFDTKVQGIRRARDAKEVELQQRRVEARDAFFNDVSELVGQLMLERGASVILDRRSVFLALSAADVTDLAISRIDAVLLDRDRDGAPAQPPMADGALVSPEPTPDADPEVSQDPAPTLPIP